MSVPSAGWFPDPGKTGQMRWWDGQQWTTYTAPPAPPVGTLPPPATVPSVRKRRVPIWLWAVLGVVGIVAGIFLAPLVALMALVVMITGIVAMVKSRPTWLRFPSRTAAVIATVVSAVLFFAVGSLTGVIYPSAPAPVSAAPAGEPPVTPTPTPMTTPFLDDEADVAAFAGTVSTAKDASTTTGRTALAVLATLEVKGRAAKTGYDRDQFGQRWMDVDRNGCDTRNDILARDLTDTALSGPCRVTAGTLVDPYTGTEVDFVRGQGTSELVQIDHVVSLSDAWQKGAQLLSLDQRTSLANDPLNLLAVSGAANAQKGDGDAATWLPSHKSFRCAFVARQVAVKATYGLWVTQAEHDAIARILSDCPDEPAPTSPFAAIPDVPAPVEEAAAPQPAQPAPAAPAPAQPQPAQPAPAPAPEAPAPPAPAPAAPATAFYANCDAVRAAGASPLYAHQPGYSRKLDRDGDGVACE